MTFVPDVVSLSPNHSPGQPSGKKVIVHATRSGVSMNPTEFEGTLNWFAMPASEVSAHGLIGRDGRIARIVPDSQTAWHAEEHNATCWGWELEQGVESDGFTMKQMESWAAVARYYVDVFGVEPQHIMDINLSGFIGHSETPQGLAVGKSDPGSQFMWQAFIASLQEDDMALEFFKRADGTVFAIGPYGKRPVQAPEWAVYRQAGYTAKEVDNLGEIPNYSSGGGGGLTEDQTRAIVRKELDRETKAV